MNDISKRLLIVDDEPYIRQSLCDFFEDRSWITAQAVSGEDAISVLDSQQAAAAIVDIRMGGMDGNTFIRQSYQRHPNLTFVICTGSPEYEIPADLKALPCVCTKLFRKPIANFEELEQTILTSTKQFGLEWGDE